jgi:hypothetical protein
MKTVLILIILVNIFLKKGYSFIEFYNQETFLLNSFYELKIYKEIKNNYLTDLTNMDEIKNSNFTFIVKNMNFIHAQDKNFGKFLQFFKEFSEIIKEDNYEKLENLINQTNLNESIANIKIIDIFPHIHLIMKIFFQIFNDLSIFMMNIEKNIKLENEKNETNEKNKTDTNEKNETNEKKIDEKINKLNNFKNEIFSQFINFTLLIEIFTKKKITDREVSVLNLFIQYFFNLPMNYFLNNNEKYLNYNILLETYLNYLLFTKNNILSDLRRNDLQKGFLIN